jgi:hypothetical protein
MNAVVAVTGLFMDCSAIHKQKNKRGEREDGKEHLRKKVQETKEKM